MDVTFGILSAPNYWTCGEHCVGGQYLVDNACNCACVFDTTCNPTPAPTNPTKNPTPSPTQPTANPTPQPSESPTVWYDFKCLTRESLPAAGTAIVGCEAGEIMMSCGFESVSSTETSHFGAYINNDNNGMAEECVAEGAGGNVKAHARCCHFTDLIDDVECIGFDPTVYITGGDDSTQVINCGITPFPLVT